jgi:uncharacterized protein YijF (DUF1287 family)
MWTVAKYAESIVDPDIIYDPAYYKIPYPMGDVPADRGVCTDVIIRTYRKLGIDLQKLVHEDMKSNFDKYPKKWGLKSPDTNIDHRRVANLMTFFKRAGGAKYIADDPKYYKPGDMVVWDLGHGVLHIGMVSTKKSDVDKNRYMIVHNIGYGQVLDDILFNYEIIGHYWYITKE